jgi:HD-like signal output (HDOD) protein
MNENILKKIKSLPPLPKSVMEIQKITSDPDGSIGDLIKVVKEDPMLTANLLKAANSPLYGFSRQIKNVDQAVSLFGMSTVKGFAVASAVRSSMKIDLSAYGLSETKFVSVSQLQNALVVVDEPGLNHRVLHHILLCPHLDSLYHPSPLEQHHILGEPLRSMHVL